MLQIKKYRPTSHKIKALVYWGTWSWKTSFGWTAPKVIFASAEAGLLSLWGKDISYAEIKSVQDLRELLKYLQWDHDFETVVLDSITEINDIIKAEIERKKWKPMQLQDWWVLAKDIEKILRAFRGLDMNVIMIAQEKIIEDDGKIDKRVPDLNGKSADKIAYFMDIVGHMEILWDWTHIINVSPDPRLVTKDRTRMLWTDTVPDFKKWLEALEDMEIVEVEEITQELDMDKEKEIEEEEKEEGEVVLKKEKVISKKTWDKVLDKVIEEVVEEKIEEEEEEDQNLEKFNQIYEEIKMCANEDQLDEILSNLRDSLNNKEFLFTVDQKNEIKSLKEDMVNSFKATKPKKKTTTKKTQTK